MTKHTISPGLLSSVIYVNGIGNIHKRKNLIPLTQTKTETKKLQKTETKRKNLKRKLINLAMSVFVSVVFPFHAITQVFTRATLC